MMDRKDPTEIVNFCSSLSSKNWNCLQFFEDGMLETILLFPPWLKRLMKHYSSPIIVDATFTTDQYRIYTSIQLDGERHSQISGIAVRFFED